MNKLKFSFVLAITLMAFASCKKNDTGNSGQSDFNRASSAGVGADSRTWPASTATIPSTINNGTYTLTNDKVWFLDGPTFVGSAGILKIQPNTLIKGRSNSVRGTSYLVVTRGGKIEADGVSASTSIVFTSDKAPNNREPGDWGGIIILGDAPNYHQYAEGIIEHEIPPNYSIYYGGANAGHNGGILNFVRIEFAGRNLGWGNEINSLTLGGVGTGTKLENIQVSYGLDDGFEFFGGTVNAKNLISFGTADDDFDFDYGYVGNIQFAVALRDPSVHNYLSSDPNGIESDNNSTGEITSSVRTHPVLSNFTILGYNGNPAGLLNGVRFRRASRFALHNSLIAGWYTSGAYFDGTATLNDLISGVSTFKNNAVQGLMDDVNPNPSASWVGYVSNSPLQIGTTPTPAAFVRLANPFSPVNPDFRYVTGSPAASNYSYTGLPAFFNTNLAYRGAFGATSGPRWDDFWASYQPKTNAY